MRYLLDTDVKIELSPLSRKGGGGDSIDAMASHIAIFYYWNKGLYNRQIKIKPKTWTNMPFINPDHILNFTEVLPLIAERFDKNPLVVEVLGEKQVIKWIDGFGAIPQKEWRHKDFKEYYVSFTPEMVSFMHDLGHHWAYMGE